SRRRHTRFSRDWSSDVCSSDLRAPRLWMNPPPTARAPPSGPSEPAECLSKVPDGSVTTSLGSRPPGSVGHQDQQSPKGQVAACAPMWETGYRSTAPMEVTRHK